VRLTNSDPRLLRKFIDFLKKFFNIDKKKLRFSIQIFGDILPKKALTYWRRELDATKDQFYKTIVSKVRGKGTYKYKSEYGVVIVYFNNIKLKRLICSMIENIR
jgi:inorganic triphosphatase YgiF